ARRRSERVIMAVPPRSFVFVRRRWWKSGQARTSAAAAAAASWCRAAPTRRRPVRARAGLSRATEAQSTCFATGRPAGNLMRRYNPFAPFSIGSMIVYHLRRTSEVPALLANGLARADGRHYLFARWQDASLVLDALQAGSEADPFVALVIDADEDMLAA